MSPLLAKPPKLTAGVFFYLKFGLISAVSVVTIARHAVYLIYHAVKSCYKTIFRQSNSSWASEMKEARKPFPSLVEIDSWRGVLERLEKLSVFAEG